MLGPSGDSAASMLLDPLSFLEQVSSTYQPIVGLIMGGQEVILVADPAAAQQVLIDKAAIYRKVSSLARQARASHRLFIALYLARQGAHWYLQLNQAALHTHYCTCWLIHVDCMQIGQGMSWAAEQQVFCAVAILLHAAALATLPMFSSHYAEHNGTLCAMQEGTAFFPGSSLAGNGLLVSDGAVWQRQRQLTNPGFRKAAVETYASVSLTQ